MSGGKSPSEWRTRERSELGVCVCVMPLFNTTSITVVFPKHTNDYTCFDNPIYHNVQLTINGQNYPDEPVSTLGARFLQYQLVASEWWYSMY